MPVRNAPLLRVDSGYASPSVGFACVSYEGFIVIAVMPRFVSGEAERQSPPFATDCRPRFNVMSPEIGELVNTFAFEVTRPQKWTWVTCPDDDVIVK